MATTKPVEVVTAAQGRKPLLTRASSFQSVYVNSVNLEVSNWDVRFRLGLVQGVEDGTIQIEEQAHVLMSHSHARAFHKAMGEIIAKLDAFDSSGEIIEGEKKG